MFSAYVVVGGPPTAAETAVARPSPSTARPSTGSRFSPVISPTALTCPVFSAINAITPGSTSSAAETLKDGECRVGSPNQSAEATESSCTRACVVTWPSGPGAVIGPATRSRTQDRT
ncbi:hypothetical protein HDC93_004754 [Streptomyces sp. AK010]|nr:hypothetical protein [Streptomyces sp. AK010]